ncbi:hypothetical protein P8A18_29105 [Streptomyces castrisilvae]|uniref:Uncharacterized protein n=1 Tax=Streptomyces castrisilvae TaxID=3033811 RepID=A0ABY9HUZ5_9ACTN|nr:hypothetical protein [Streptomyces sp. Mut1]WLQ37246.1 hypothetical protein P8A18_29105 [Streptomyces sp. Mut1]
MNSCCAATTSSPSPSPTPPRAALLRVLYAITARIADLTEQGPSGDWDEHQLDILDEGRLQAAKVDAYFAQQLLDPSRTYEGPDPEEQMVDLWDPVTGSVPAGINHGTQP